MVIKKVVVDFSFKDIFDGFKMQVEDEILKLEIQKAEDNYRDYFIKKLNRKKGE